MSHQGSDTDNKIWRESSYKFWGRGPPEEFDFQPRGKTEEAGQDPPTRLIGQFLHRQNASGDFSLDIDLEMQELREETEPTLPPVAEESPSPSPLNGRPSKASKVSFDEELRNGDGGGGGGGDDYRVVRCTSNASFRSSDSFKRKSRVLTPKSNKSRLLDPPQSDQPPSETRSTRSGMLTRRVDEEDEDDPFSGEDLPEEYKKAKVDLLVVLEWVSLILLVGSLVCSRTVPYLKEKTLWKLKLWKWEVMVLVLICGRLVSSWGIRVIVFFIERNFLLRKRVLYFVYGLRKAVQNCLWLGQVLVAWHFLFNKKVARETDFLTVYYITKVLVCLIVGTLIWLVKTLVVKALASSFHVSTYFERIQESLFNQYVIETLSGPPLVEIRRADEEVVNINNEVEKLKKAGASVPSEIGSALMSARGSRRIAKSPLRGTGKGEDGITVDHLHKLSPRNVSAWNMKRLINLVRRGHLTTLDEQITHDEPCTPISSESEAKVAAKRIFLNVAQQGSRYIFIEDLMRFMVEDEAMKTMSLFEGASESHMISKSSLKSWVVKAFRERRALALSLDDTKTAVNKLHHMVNTLVGIVVLIICLQIMGIATKKFLLLVTSQLLLVVFIFGNSCKNTFESIIFLFVMHPFDVGDRCEVDGVEMVVEEMNILTTVFLRSDNLKIVIPNSVLATKAISNYYRSPDMGDAVEFSVHISVPAEKLAIMKQRITSYIEGKKEHWHPAPMIIIKNVEDLTRLGMAVWLRHRMNHQDMGEKWARRALLVEEMVMIFRELDIQYRLLPLDVNVRTGPSSWNAQSG
ncbi:hypothetical protein MLD38_017442 [Melastoma candidum]|uniref:Uncharacterized protein n=1 Tax=Melastoma candidum TaxID=119954 RepID=A0ACB9QRY6_9MYRT|nr:hypothetical protein MLD38_017442 [Melastoma candidum]